MGTIYRILICCVVAIPASALYNGCVTNGSISFSFNTMAALSFTAVALACVLLTSFNPSASNNQSSPKKTFSSKGRQQGEVKWFNGSKGFGFITCDNGEEIFVHFRSVQKDSKRLSPGKRVEFSIVQGKKGNEADAVVVV